MYVGYPDDLLVRHVGAGHGQLEVAAAVQPLAHVLQLQRRQPTQLREYAPDHVVVQVPRLVQAPVFACTLCIQIVNTKT